MEIHKSKIKEIYLSKKQQEEMRKSFDNVLKEIEPILQKLKRWREDSLYSNIRI